MKILSTNPCHDGAIAYVKDSRLVFSLEAEKNSAYRYSPIFAPDVFSAFRELDELPDVICTSGWWPSDAQVPSSRPLVGYRGVDGASITVNKTRMLGREVYHFSSSHERSHLLCAFGLSSLPMGSPCYALLWEGSIGAFYEIDERMTIKRIADVMSEPGQRYALLYGLADPSFDKDGPYALHSHAGKLMALAAFSNRSIPSLEEEELMDFMLQDTVHLEPRACRDIKCSRYLDVGVEDPEFRNFAGIFSDKIFDTFFRFAQVNLKKQLPLIIAGGCGLNCDWNAKWRDSGLFPEIFVPPVANDSGCAIGTAIDAQLHFTGNAKLEWSVYSGLCFNTAGSFDLTQYDVREVDVVRLADMLANDLVLGWVKGKYEIGPRALGNRSILAAPFKEHTHRRLNAIKQREQFRPIAPVCLYEDAAQWFGCEQPSPHMLYTYRARSDELAAVTHVNKTARIQTVSRTSNPHLYDLLEAFKVQTGYGVLCNTSLNFKDRGFINNMPDLSAYCIDRGLDGFVVGEKSFLLKSSLAYQNYLKPK